MDVARITSFGLARPLPPVPGGRSTATVATPAGPSGATIDLADAERRSRLGDPAALAWERSLVDLRRQGATGRSDGRPGEHLAEPGLRRAAETLGVRGRLNQDEVDRRFREIVKAERPDLGGMSGERLDEVRAARTTLTAHLQRARWLVGAGAPPPGTISDIAA
jgi:hypothetical protein